MWYDLTKYLDCIVDRISMNNFVLFSELSRNIPKVTTNSVTPRISLKVPYEMHKLRFDRSN